MQTKTQINSAKHRLLYLSDLQVGFSVQVWGLNVAHGLWLAAEMAAKLKWQNNYTR